MIAFLRSWDLLKWYEDIWGKWSKDAKGHTLCQMHVALLLSSQLLRKLLWKIVDSMSIHDDPYMNWGYKKCCHDLLIQHTQDHLFWTGSNINAYQWPINAHYPTIKKSTNNQWALYRNIHSSVQKLSTKWGLFFLGNASKTHTTPLHLGSWKPMSYVWSFFCLAVNAFAEPIIRTWDIVENACMTFERNTFVNQFLELAHKILKFQLVSGFFHPKTATFGGFLGGQRSLLIFLPSRCTPRALGIAKKCWTTFGPLWQGYLEDWEIYLAF